MLQLISGNRVLFVSVAFFVSLSILPPTAAAQTEGQSIPPKVFPAAEPDAPAVAPVAEPAAPAEPPKEEDLFGRYGSKEGAVAEIYRGSESGDWVMTYVRPGERPMTLFLAGDPASLKPVGLDITTSFNGKPMSIIGDGGRLYAKGASEKESIEGLLGEQGEHLSAGPETPESAELSHALRDYSAEWSRMRAAKVSLEPKQMKIISAGAADGQAFQRIQPLSESDVNTMRERLAARANGLEELNAFAARASKLEGKQNEN